MQTTETKRTNPFFEPYNTPHDVVPFDKIEECDFKPAILEGIRREEAEHEEIATNPEAPTFENTILRLVHGTDLLDRVETVMGNMLSACTSDNLQAIAEEMSPILAEHYHKMAYDERMFKRIKAIKKSKPQLTEEEQTLLDKMYDGYLKIGVGLSKKKKARIKEISNDLSLKRLKFSQNVLKDTNRFQLHITDKAELSGLTELQLEMAHQAAQEKGLDGWLFTLHAPSMRPLLTYCDNRELRRKVWLAHNTLCIKKNKYNNLDLVRDIVNLRLESVQIRGHKTFAQSALKERMAEKTSTVEKFLDQLIEAYKPVALKDYKELEEYAKSIEGKDFKMRSWDSGYYSHKLHLEKYSYDAEMLRPYFELNNVIKGVFGLATTLYGITFKEVDNIPKYHEDVKTFEVYDNNGDYLAVLYTDFHPRSNKKSGAWMTSFQGQYINKEGENIRPHVSLVMNLTKPTDSKPALLTLGEVCTFLHEFGHGLHEMFSQCRFASLAGTNVYWDFVELPSQFMENFATEKEFLQTFAFHYQTGEVIPDELIERVLKSQHYGAGLACMRQVSFCLLDMAYYTRSTPLDEDIIKFEKKAWERALVRKNNMRICMSTQFNHIMTGGYASGYYCYKWAEVLDADAFGAFKEEGIFNPETAERFRREILEKGNTKHPKILYKNFRHRNPSIKAMLRRDGIIK